SPECAATGLLPLEAAELHYLRRVLRFRPGDRLAVVDGRGRLWTALLAAGDAVQLEQAPAEPRAGSAAPAAGSAARRLPTAAGRWRRTPERPAGRGPPADGAVHGP
ncbi:MAG: RNA methyltransferase PUA domain-containing protein, partial [Cyanobacteriota bacterium]